MSWLVRFLNLFRSDALSRDLAEELEFHLDSRTRDNARAGMTPDAAGRDARRRFGNATLARERTHEAEIYPAVETLVRDLRYSTRSLMKSPGFTIVAVFTLALGFGASIAVFTVVNGVLLRPLPFPEPGRLFLVSLKARDGVFLSGPGLYDTDYLAFVRQDRSFESVATFGEDAATLTGAGEAVRLPAASVTSGFFKVLQSRPFLGRAFLPSEEAPGSNPVVILSDRVWRNRFDGDPNIVGKPVTLDGTAHTVVGVMPSTFAFPPAAALWLPLAVGADPGNSYFRPVIGRLRPTISREQALEELKAYAKDRPKTAGDTGSGAIAEVLPMKDLLVADIRRQLLVFMGAVVFVLLIACANAANLLLMRGTSRQREIAVRSALGARRGRLVRQLLTESTLVSLAGSIAGVALAIPGVHALLALAPAAGVPRLAEIHMDGPVVVFTLLLGALTGLVFGTVPALQATRRAPRASLSQGGTTLTARRERLRASLVVAEIALSLVLLTGAGLMLKSFVRLRSVDPGFQPRDVITISVDLPEATYRNAASIHDFQSRVLDRIEVLPGVEAAGAVNWLPFHPNLVMGDFQLDGGRKLPPGYVADKPAVSPGYFGAMGIRLLRGRNFNLHDSRSAPGVAIVSESVARTLWPGTDPIGQRISMEDHPKPNEWLTVVGVVQDIRQQTLSQDLRPAIYQPLEQVSRTFFLNHVSFAVRTAASREGMASSLREIVQQVDANQPVTIAAMTDLMDATTAETWFQARLITAFSILALVLAAVGIYGVMAYSVTERTREIGIRMALGATRNHIAQMLLRRTLFLSAAGVTIGAAAAMALTRVLAKLLFLVKPTDPEVFLLVAAILTVIGTIAGLLPARSATRIDPMLTLRRE